jgi:3-oxoacyl-[acyl-carrier protein] reductase
MQLAGKVAVVTGSGRGIGRAIAVRFAREGAAILLTSRSADELSAVLDEIRRGGGRAESVAADLSRPADCEAVIAAARRHFGRVDILVNNAGIFGPVKACEEITNEEWDEVVAVNLRAPFLLARQVLPEMYARGSGVILNISSVAAKMAYAWETPYAATKAGLLGLTRGLAAEAARKGVRVNALCPGPVFETRMSRELGQSLSAQLGVDPAQQVKDFANTVLQGRGQTAEEIAAAALFLVSEQASAITGQAVNVDGGVAFC